MKTTILALMLALAPTCGVVAQKITLGTKPRVLLYMLINLKLNYQHSRGNERPKVY